ncbi:hypothetical protein ACYJ1Y_02155 [Natrialbaceae archaeon A-gly3]
MTARGRSSLEDRWILGASYAIAVGHVLLVGLFPDGIDLPSFVLFEGVFLLVVLAAARDTSSPSRFVAAALVGVLVLGGMAWLVLRSGPLWLAALLTLSVLALAVYGLRRYGRLELEAASGPTRRRGDTHERPS